MIYLVGAGLITAQSGSQLCEPKLDCGFPDFLFAGRSLVLTLMDV